LERNPVPEEGGLSGEEVKGPVGRLAPSPTGALHLGNARTFLAAWLSVRSRGGACLLRIEDLDGPRVKREAVAETLEDLSWLGLDWDGEPMLQSPRIPRYETARMHLEAKGWIYPCVCTRSEIAAAQSAPQGPKDHGMRYPGTCRGRFADAAQARAETGKDPAWRFRVPEGTVVPFRDRFHGEIEVPVDAEVGDFVVAKRDGQPAYQLAVVVDDADFGIDEVCRGDDLLSSTGRQLLLYEALGARPPDFLHLPLVVGPDGRRLAKRHGDTRLSWFRRRGVPAAEVCGFLAWTLGLRPTREPTTPDRLLADFRPEAIPRESYVLEGDPFGKG